MAHKAPSNWRELATTKSADVRNVFNRNIVGVVLAVDEKIMRHHEWGGRGDEVLVSRGKVDAPNE